MFSTLLLFVTAHAAAVSPPDRQPIYPVWVAGPGANPCAGQKIGVTVSTAVHLGQGYLAAPIDAFKSIVQDLSKDERVCLIDGGSVVEGRLVDFKENLRIVLMKAPLKGPAVTMAESPSNPYVLIGLDARALRTPFPVAQMPLRPCNARFAALLKEDSGLVCAIGDVKTYSGGAGLDARGRLAVLFTAEFNGMFLGGPSAADLRAFVDGYFNSWGRYVPMDKRPWKTKSPGP